MSENKSNLRDSIYELDEQVGDIRLKQESSGITSEADIRDLHSKVKFILSFFGPKVEEKEIKSIVQSVRVTPEDKTVIIARYGTFQKFVDYMIIVQDEKLKKYAKLMKDFADMLDKHEKKKGKRVIDDYAYKG